MNRLPACALCVAVVVLSLACSSKEASTNQSASQPTNQPSPQSSIQTSQQPAPMPDANQPAGELQPGQASGSFTARGEVVELKYSYAGRAERFGTQSLVVLVTDKPIPPEAVAEEIKQRRCSRVKRYAVSST